MIHSSDQHLFSSEFNFLQFVQWSGPRILVAGVFARFSLGIAYEKDIMYKIDRAAIVILRHTVGRVGIGTVMPTFQWYAAWGVRISAAIIGGLIYDLVEKIVRYIYNVLMISSNSPSADQEQQQTGQKLPEPITVDPSPKSQ